MDLTLTEKILFKHTKQDPSTIIRGETYLELTPDRVIMQDATAQMALLQFISSGCPSPRVPVSIHCDHLIKTDCGFQQDLCTAREDNKEVYDFLKSCCIKYGMDWWGPGKGIIHQIALEHYDKPGSLIFGTDSHTPTGGAESCISIGVGGADAVDAMVGETVEVLMPKILNINLVGSPKPFVTAKDIILCILSILGTKGGTGYVLEYSGEGCIWLSTDDRATICNMGAECGATTSIFPSSPWLSSPPFTADPNPWYDDVIQIDLSEIEPQISGPFSPDLSDSIYKKDFGDAPDIISSVLIGSCTNSSYRDLATVGEYLKSGVELKSKLIIVPGSEGIYNELDKHWYIDVFKEKGVTIATPACGPCIGQWVRPDAGKNTIITTFNRNFRARNDGNPNTYAFITSPITALRYAVSGSLRHPANLPTVEVFPVGVRTVPDKIEYNPNQEINIKEGSSRLQLLKRFPSHSPVDFYNLQVLRKVVGKCTTDNISPAGPWLKYRGHLENISKNFLLTASFTKDYKHDPWEDARALGGSVVIGDWNYGEGSSREHAALEARYLGVQCVIARSFARIHETNLKKQGVLPLVFDDPEDYNKIHEDSMISVDTSHLRETTAVDVKVDYDLIIKTHHTLSPRQIEWLEKGSSLNCIGINIPVIVGDGIGPEVTSATMDIISTVCPDIHFFPIQYNDYDTIKTFKYCLKGPLTTPVGTGHRSYNVQLRQELDLFACVRPVMWYGNESPVRHPEKVNMVVFRENTEDLYAGYEWKAGTDDAKELCDKIGLERDASIGLKIISEPYSKRLMRSACEYAMAHGRKHITIVHKGNIMKWTEGCFREWCYDVAREYPEITVDDCICDAFLQNSLLHPEKYDIIVTTNLNGDYISDALAAQVGGVGISPGVNTNGDVSVYEATHGSAPDIAGRGLACPLSCLLSACMMLDDMGRSEEARIIRLSITVAIEKDPQTTDEWVKYIKESCLSQLRK